MMDEEQKFAMFAAYVRVVAESMLRVNFGERCKDFDPDCECCRRWKLLDDLTANPFE